MFLPRDSAARLLFRTDESAAWPAAAPVRSPFTGSSRTRGLTHSDVARRGQNPGLAGAEAPSLPTRHRVQPPLSHARGRERHSDLQLTGHLRKDVGSRVPRGHQGAPGGHGDVSPSRGVCRLKAPWCHRPEAVGERRVQPGRRAVYLLPARGDETLGRQDGVRGVWPWLVHGFRGRQGRPCAGPVRPCVPAGT